MVETESQNDHSQGLISRKEMCEKILEVFKGEIIKVWDSGDYQRHLNDLNAKSCYNLMKIMSGFNVSYSKSSEVKGRFKGFDKAKKWGKI